MFRKALAATLLLTLMLPFAAAERQNSPSTQTVLIDINTAPLQVLEGIVLERDLAQRIIDNRPYANKRQLLTRRLVSMEQYDTIKDRIVARRILTPGESQ